MYPSDADTTERSSAPDGRTRLCAEEINQSSSFIANSKAKQLNVKRMPRSFLVKKKTKDKEEGTLSCDAGGQVVDALVDNTRQQKNSVTAGTTSAAHMTAMMRLVNMTVAGDQQRDVQTPPPATNLLSSTG